MRAECLAACGGDGGLIDCAAADTAVADTAVSDASSDAVDAD